MFLEALFNGHKLCFKNYFHVSFQLISFSMSKIAWSDPIKQPLNTIKQGKTPSREAKSSPKSGIKIGIISKFIIKRE